MIKLNFKKPTKELIDYTIDLYSNTNRFIVSKHIKLYNDLLKGKRKKYYIENTNANIITFFRRNNKCIFNFVILDKPIREFLLKYFLDDILFNTEVIILSNEYIKQYYNKLNPWNGNVVIHE